jgi:hypothetical protein
MACSRGRSGQPLLRALSKAAFLTAFTVKGRPARPARQHTSNAAVKAGFCCLPGPRTPHLLLMLCSGVGGEGRRQERHTRCLAAEGEASDLAVARSRACSMACARNGAAAASARAREGIRVFTGGRAPPSATGAGTARAAAAFRRRAARRMLRFPSPVAALRRRSRRSPRPRPAVASRHWLTCRVRPGADGGGGGHPSRRRNRGGRRRCVRSRRGACRGRSRWRRGSPAPAR